MNQERLLEVDGLTVTYGDGAGSVKAVDEVSLHLHRVELGHQHVHRLAPHPDAPYLLPPAREDGLLPSYDELARALADGATVTIATAPGGALQLRIG